MNWSFNNRIDNPETDAVAAVQAMHPGVQPALVTAEGTIAARAEGESVLGGDRPSHPLVTRATKAAIRTSLKASTVDGVFAAVFSNVTGGVLLTNFLLDLGATPSEFGLLAAIPMLANLLQPVGAYWSEQTTSRHLFCLWIYGPARALWLLLVVGIGLVQADYAHPHVLIGMTMAIALLSHSFGALGSAAWFSWMAVLVPRRLRGRYFGLRNSAANLTNLISVPLLGLLVSWWGGGSLQGYSIALGLGIVAGLVSLWFQNFIVDVNPQVQQAIATQTAASEQSAAAATSAQFSGPPPISGEGPVPVVDVQTATLPALPANLLYFLLYFGLWMFAINLSAPFFNLYLLDNLHRDVSQATLYNSLAAGANLLMLLFWGKLADRIGNRPILLSVGVLVALSPLLWLGVGGDVLSVWLWLPLLHGLMGGTGAAIDLCSSNLQIDVTPIRNQATYFGSVAAVTGISGALGTLVGGALAQNWSSGLLGLFVLSSIVRLVALLPLLLVQEDRSHSLRQLMAALFPVQTSEQLE